MSKAVLFAVLAPMVYAIGNVLLEYKFSKYNNLTLIICYCSVIVVGAAIVRALVKDDTAAYDFPAGNALLLVVLLGLIFLAADYFFIGAYTNGGDLLTITILTLLFPVFASAFKFVASKFLPGMIYALPNAWQVGGYLLAIVAVLMVVKGSPPPK